MGTPDLQPLSAFEERLLAELKDVVAARTPAATAKSHTKRWVAAGTVLAGWALLGTGTAPAYAVDRDPDGSIRVSIFDYRDPQGLQQRLTSFGVRAAVTYLPAGTACREPRADYVAPERMPLELVDFSPLEGNGTYFKLRPEYIGPGQTFVFTVQVSGSRRDHVQRFAIRLADGPVAACARVPGDVVPSPRR